MAFFQSTVNRSGDHAGNFEVLVHFRDKTVDPPGRGSGSWGEHDIDYLATYSYDWGQQKWLGGQTVTLAAQEGGGAVGGLTGRPCYLQVGQRYGNANYVIVAPQGDHIGLYLVENTQVSDATPRWMRKPALPVQADPTSGVVALSVDSAAAFVSPTYAIGGWPNLELVGHFNETRIGGGGPHGGVEKTFDYLATYYFDWGHETWSDSSPIVADGSGVGGVARF